MIGKEKTWGDILQMEGIVKLGWWAGTKEILVSQGIKGMVLPNFQNRILSSRTKVSL
jgi:hypothetical protein